MKAINTQVINSVDKVLVGGQVKYLVTLEPNYSFRNSGTQTAYCDFMKEVQTLTDEIEFCNGEELKLR